MIVPPGVNGALKVIFAKPFPAIPATLLGAVGTAAWAGTGINAKKIAPKSVNTTRFRYR